MKTFFFAWLLLATVGTIAAGIFLIRNGLQFKSSYSHIYILVGFMVLFNAYNHFVAAVISKKRDHFTLHI
ncbi:DUF5381 family protein [Metabacillus sp. KIGAM252]|uniref:DUF5381 family protein n=1 Tax=Metabacillus flavus TaxID=2823519 RepID=A0ABS5LJJ4_9BACI|nr:DUF5381 family protein [Metabacillus flavus]